MSEVAQRAKPDSPEVLERFQAALPLAESIARRMNKPVSGFGDFDSLLSAARVGLLEAARRYEVSVGIPFPAFASYRIRGAVMDEIRRLAPHSRRVHARLAAAAKLSEMGEANHAWNHDVPVKSPASAEKALDDSLAALALSAAVSLSTAVSLSAIEEKAEPADAHDLSDSIERRDLVEKVRLELSSLGAEEAEVVKQHYFADRSLTEVAADLGLTLSWVSRLHGRAIARLAERFADSATMTT